LVEDVDFITLIHNIIDYLENKGFTKSMYNIAVPDHGGYIAGADNGILTCKVYTDYMGYLGKYEVDQELTATCGFLPY